jgi:peptidoglycan-N-acetylglucosamine deacetylase
MIRHILAVLFAPIAVLAQSTAPATPPKPAQPAQPAEPATPVPAAAPAPTAKVTYSQCHVEGPYIAMTFDDGPHATQTPRLLDMLKQRNIKATFYCVGQCVAEYPEIAKRIVQEGHEIANHSWSHPQLSTMSEASVRDQIERTHQAIKQATGVEAKTFRPPYGAFTVRQRNWAYSVYGYKTILWDVDTLDWKHHNPARTEAIALQETKAGSIILQHDIHKATIDAMPATLDALAAKGFKFVTVTELLAMDKPLPPKATPAPKPAGASKAKPAAPQ